MSPLRESCRLICPSLAVLQPPLGSTIWEAKLVPTQAREQAQSHILTHTDEVIQMVGITAAVWPLMAC